MEGGALNPPPTPDPDRCHIPPPWAPSVSCSPFSILQRLGLLSPPHQKHKHTQTHTQREREGEGRDALRGFYFRSQIVSKHSHHKKTQYGFNQNTKDIWNTSTLFWRRRSCISIIRGQHLLAGGDKNMEKVEATDLKRSTGSRNLKSSRKKRLNTYNRTASACHLTTRAAIWRRFARYRKLERRHWRR